MSLRDAARKVVQSLESKPGLFYEVLRIVRDEFEVLGPWEDSPDGRESSRYDIDGGSLSVISYQVSADRYDWQVVVGGLCLKAGSCNSLDEAKVAVDRELRDLGYLLS